MSACSSLHRKQRDREREREEVGGDAKKRERRVNGELETLFGSVNDLVSWS